MIFLRRALNVNTPPGYMKKGARVLQRDPANGNRTFRINCGSDDGVKVGQAVLAGEYLAGRILETSAKTSVVTSVSDPNCHVAVRVVDLLKAEGVMFGQGEELWKQSPYCLVRYLPRDLEYGEGMLVVTSEKFR